MGVDLGARFVALGRIAVEDHPVAGAGDLVHRDQHLLDRAAERIGLHHRPLGKALLEVAHDHQALLQRLAIVELERRQRGGAAGLLEQPVGPRLRDVDLDVRHDRMEPLQLEQDLDPLGKGQPGMWYMVRMGSVMLADAAPLNLWYGTHTISVIKRQPEIASERRKAAGSRERKIAMGTAPLAAEELLETADAGTSRPIAASLAVDRPRLVRARPGHAGDDDEFLRHRHFPADGRAHQARLRADRFQLGLLLGPAGILFYVFVGIPLARLVDIYPRTIILGIGLVVTSGMTAVGGLAQILRQFFASRMFVGVGGSAHAPGTYSMLADYFPPKRLPRAFAFLQLGFILGAGLGAIVGGMMLGYVAGWEPTQVGPFLIRNWQWVLIWIAVPGLLIAALHLPAAGAAAARQGQPRARRCRSAPCSARSGRGAASIIPCSSASRSARSRRAGCRPGAHPS